jgi:hypothetical protein
LENWIFLSKSDSSLIDLQQEKRSGSKHNESFTMVSEATEKKALLDSSAVSGAAVAGAGLVNASAEKIRQARADGPLTFRMLGFLGGLAMILSNGLAILERFFSFNLAGALIAIYGVFFGTLIVLMDAPMPGFCATKVQGSIRYYFKFLEFTLGRGMFFFFVGTLQIANWNMLDWAVGGFMIFVGVVSIGVGIATARQMRLLRFAVKDEAQLKKKWAEHDADGNGTLDVKELTAFVQDADVGMTRNEIAATFMALGTYIYCCSSRVKRLKWMHGWS